MQREEKVLVCLSGSPSNARVVRAAAKIAEAFRGTLVALLSSLRILSFPRLGIRAGLPEIFTLQKASVRR